MDSTKSPTFEDMREQLGLKPRLLYGLKTVAEVTGVPYDTLLGECKRGRLREWHGTLAPWVHHVEAGAAGLLVSAEFLALFWLVAA